MITIPTLSTLYTSIISDIEAEYGATINPFGKAMLRGLAAVQAGKLKLYYIMLALLQKNVAPDTCDEETLYRFGKIKINRLPFPATAGKYTVTVTGTAGGTIAARTTFKSDDDSLNPGVLFILDNSYTLPGTTGSIVLRALTLGTAGKLEIGDTLTSTVPIALVDSGATVTAETIQPLDGETVEAYRKVVIQSYRLEAQGGAATDYRIWSSDAQGVERVYPYARSGYPGEINLYIEATIADSIDGQGTPSAQIITDVESVVNFNPDTTLPTNERGRRPLQVVVNYLPITPKQIVINIDSFNGINAGIQATLLTAITSTINKIRPFVAAADILTDKNDILDANQIIATILTARPGSIFGAITFTVDGVAYSSYQFQAGNIPHLQSVTYS